MIRPGQKLDLRLPLKVVRSGRIEDTTLGDLVRRRTIVSVYMKNHTPGCDRQNASLREVRDELAAAGFDLVAVSRDTGASHAKYAAAKGLRHPLVSDPQDGFARATGSLIEKSMYGRKFLGPARAAYLLDPDGTVRAVLEKIDTHDHAAQLRQLAAAHLDA